MIVRDPKDFIAVVDCCTKNKVSAFTITADRIEVYFKGGSSGEDYSNTGVWVNESENVKSSYRKPPTQTFDGDKPQRESKPQVESSSAVAAQMIEDFEGQTVETEDEYDKDFILNNPPDSY